MSNLRNTALLLGVTLDFKAVDPTSGTVVKTQIGQAFQFWANNNYDGVLLAADSLSHRSERFINGASSPTMTDS